MYVPMIASGELIDGYIGRIKVVSQFRDLQALKKTLVDGYRQSADYNHERKDEIRDLIEVMKSFTGKTRYELINEHTTLPAEYWNWRKIDWSTFLRKRNSATFPFLKHQPHVAKLCPECVDIDKSVTGSSIWYCVHQVDGVTYCPKHRDAKLLRAKSATYVYKRLPEWYLRHRELDPHENYTILSKTHERKVQHYGELIASLMMRRDQISDAVLIRLIEHLKRQPLHQGLKRYISFEAACAPKSWFMSSKYPRRWLWKNFPDAGDTFEVLARVRSMKKAAEELCVTPSAISHRMRLMESILQRPLFDDVDFSLSPEGEQYLQVVRESLDLLQRHSFKPNSDLRHSRVSTAH